MHKITILAAVTAALWSAPAQAQKSSQAEVLFESARQKETLEGDLKGAIEQYKKIAQGKDRAAAAKALIRMAECHQKLGDAEAKRIYEQVVREFGDQKEAAATARVRLGGGPAVHNNGIITRQVWANALDTEGAPSPDGQLLSFVDWSTGDLAIRDLATGENRRLTNKGPWFWSDDFALDSVFSPDGKQLAYAWFNSKNKRSGELRIVPSTRGIFVPTPRVLYRNDEMDFIKPADWSADGKQILALIRRKDRTHQIAMVSVADGSARILKTFDWRAPMKMSLSPDGRYIVYDFPPKDNSPQRDIFVLASDGSRETTLLADPANDASPVWTPDGKRILFTSDRTGANGAWVLRVTEGKADGPPDLIKSDIGAITPMAFTGKGSLLYGLMLRDTIVYVGTLDPAAEKLIQPVKAVSHRFTGHNLSPDWSPDGRQFAYFSSRGLSGMPGSIAICIHSFDTGKEREILPELRYIERLRWSHTGRALVVTGADNKGRKGIFEVDALSGALTPIAAAGEGIGDPVLSPDGRAIYYYSDGVVARDRETGREKQLLPRGRFMIKFLAPSWDGSKLAIVVQQSKKKSMSVYVMPSAGGEPLDILTLPENVSGMVLDWEPGGRNLIFAGANSTELWRVPAEGGKPEKLDIGMKNIGIRMLRLHPDGRQIAFSSYGAGKSEVWAMENFLPTLKASR